MSGVPARFDPLADLATLTVPPPAPVTDPWGVPEHAYTAALNRCGDCRRPLRSLDQPDGATTGGRGLCDRCRRTRERAGRRMPALTRDGRSAQHLAELAFIRSCGCTCHHDRTPHYGAACLCGSLAEWAARLGITRAALAAALRRARR